jgi:hypothetical protein
LEGLVALVLKFDGVHFVKTKGSSSRRHKNRSKVKGGGGVVSLVVLRRAQCRPFKLVARREGLGFEGCRSRISSWNAAEARRTPNKARFHNARKCKEVLEVDGGRLLVELTCPPLPARHDGTESDGSIGGLTGEVSGLLGILIGLEPL